MYLEISLTTVQLINSRHWRAKSPSQFAVLTHRLGVIRVFVDPDMPWLATMLFGRCFPFDDSRHAQVMTR